MVVFAFLQSMRYGSEPPNTFKETNPVSVFVENHSSKQTNLHKWWGWGKFNY